MQKVLAQRRRENLRKWMESQSMTLTQLASKLKVGRAYTSLLFRPDRFFGEKAARSIESKLGLPDGSLDTMEDGAPIATAAWVSPADIKTARYGLVEQTRIRPSVNPGLIEAISIALPPVAFPVEWLTAKGVRDHQKLVFGEQSGDSMYPYLDDGDVYMIDVDQADVSDGGVYAILYGGEIRVRRLSRRFDGGLLLRADNPRFPEEALTAAEAAQIRVLGRVLWRAG